MVTSDGAKSVRLGHRQEAALRTHCRQAKASAKSSRAAGVRWARLLRMRMQQRAHPAPRGRTNPTRSRRDADTLSIFSLDQGPKWREADDNSALERPKTSEVAPAWSLAVLGDLGAWLALFALRPSRRSRRHCALSRAVA